MERPMSPEVSLIPRACQKSILPSRFGRPRILPWKNNLTGLSRTHNLFFLASIDKILVFEPQFPSHELRSFRLKIRLPTTRPGLPGQHTPDSPHAINRLLIERLGTLEILAVACDDGDVIAYYIKDIQYAIDNKVFKVRQNGHWVGGDGHLLPLFHQNVGKSAWGLAVHREARMLAVSANTKEVTVYGFALTQGDGRSSPSCQNSNLFEDVTHIPVSFRDTGWRMILRSDSNASNIPDVSFCNTPEDPNGRFLASTNIHGVTTLWDLQYNCCIEEFVVRTRQRHGLFEQWNLQMSGKHGGWHVLFLDKRSFGVAKPEERQTANLFWDGNTGESEDQSSPGEEELYEDTDEISSEEEETASGIESGIESAEAEENQGTEGPPSNSNQYVSLVDQSPTHRSFIANHRPPGDLESVNERSQFWMRVLPECGAGFLSPLPNSPILLASIRDAYLLQPESDTSGRTRLIHNTDPQKPPEVVSNGKVLGLGCIMAFDFSSQLPQPFCPIQTLHNPLKESFSLSSLIHQCERLNMVDEIPELGIVVIGCGKGRVAIIQLIKRPVLQNSSETGAARTGSKPKSREGRRGDSVSVSDDIQTSTGGFGTTINHSTCWQCGKPRVDQDQWQQKTKPIKAPTRNGEIYTFKLLHKIPLQDQEQDGERPPFPLVGTAVGPVPGSRQRWRIILTYLDGSILGYEICRVKDKGNGTFGVPEIQV
ncbi:MAG: hypothetical protein M1821_009155 [Bathelium mastoideum]|nr:MAG: hypothetical protein M1821_009155 [Bathelium mastoideum]KAI9689525.1 MAG: hypothetical protein M1822_010176 [Bathelium mastoideum]